MKRFIALYSVTLGFAVIGIWTFLLVFGLTGEGKIELGFHLYSEFVMAVVCIVSGFMLLGGRAARIERGQ